MINGRHPYRRLTFVGLVIACWVVGLFGLDRSRMSSFQLPIVVAAGFIGYALVVAVRRRFEYTQDRLAHDADDAPLNAVVIRRFGEDRVPTSYNVKVIEKAVPTPIAMEPAVELRPAIELRPVLVEATVRAQARQTRRAEKKPHLNYIPLTGI